MLQLLNAVQFIHSKGIVHGDLKNRNLLINKNYHLWVIDFGQAHTVHPKKKESYHIGTLPYKPPEILLHSHFYDTSVDMWEVGRIFLELLVPRSRNYFKIEKAHKLSPEEESQGMLEKWASIYGTEVFLKVAKKHGYRMPHFKEERPASSLKRWLIWYLSHSSEKGSNRSNGSRSYRYTHYCSSEALDLLNKLLQIDPEDRITAKEALDHPYFQMSFKKKRLTARENKTFFVAQKNIQISIPDPAVSQGRSYQLFFSIELKKDCTMNYLHEGKECNLSGTS